MVLRVKHPDMRQHPIADSEQLRRLVENLRRPECFPHPVSDFHIMETHISFILLTGDHAYKFKKPVNLGFLDFSRAPQRRIYCEEELRLNRELAPDLYEGLVRITGDLERPELDGDGPLLEYAVKMHQFDEAMRLDHVTERGELTKAHIDQLADTLARFHQSTATAQPETSYGEPAEVRRPVLENFRQISQYLDDPGALNTLDRIRRWTEQSLLMLKGDFQQRRLDGWIRECHGDLHLGNIALYQGRIQLFDRLEFSESLRWIDTMNDLAFLVMDLGQRGHRNLAMRLMNRYLELTGDYLGLGVLRFYIVYRAMVRAKVAILQAQQRKEKGEDHGEQDETFAHYLDAALRYTQPPELTPLIITYGLSGSGKTWLSARLSESLGALRARSDVERKRMFAGQGDEKVPSAIGHGMYRPDVTRETYRRLHAIAYMILDAGCPAILDATFLDRDYRELMKRLATGLGMPFVILDVQAPEDTMRARVAARGREKQDASDAGLEVLQHQLDTREPLGEDERAFCVTVENDGEVDIGAVTEAVREMARGQAN